MPKNEWIIEDEPLVQKGPESFGQAALRTGAATGIKAVKNLGNLSDLFLNVLEKLGIEEPHKKLVAQGKLKPHVPISQLLQEKSGYSEEELKPQNLLESGIQRFGSQAPLAGLLGGGTGLAALGVGSAAAAIPEVLGASEGVQDATQLVTELGTGIGLGRYAGKIPSIAGAQKTENTLARAAVKPGQQFGADIIENSLNKVGTELGTEVSEKYATKIRNALQTVEENIVKGKTNPIKAADLRKKLYKLGNELPKDVAATYIEPLTKGINDFFAKHAAENPSFYNHLQARDKLTQLKHMKTYLDRGISYLDLNKVPGGRAATDLINLGVKETERLVRGVATNSAARKYYFDAVKQVAEGNPTLAIKYLNKSMEELPEYKDNPRDEWIIQ